MSNKEGNDSKIQDYNLRFENTDVWVEAFVLLGKLKFDTSFADSYGLGPTKEQLEKVRL